MDHKLFCAAYKYVLARLQDKNTSLHEEEDTPYKQGNMVVFSFEDRFEAAIYILFRMGFPYLKDSCLEGGDFNFVLRAFRSEKESWGIDYGPCPYIWEIECDSASSEDEYREIIRQTFYGLMCYFENVVTTIEMLVKES